MYLSSSQFLSFDSAISKSLWIAFWMSTGCSPVCWFCRGALFGAGVLLAISASIFSDSPLWPMYRRKVLASRQSPSVISVGSESPARDQCLAPEILHEWGVNARRFACPSLRMISVIVFFIL